MADFAEVEAAFEMAFEVLDEALIQHTDDEARIDLAGLMKEVAADAGAKKRDLVSEIPSWVGLDGKRFTFDQGEHTERSFSTNKILTDLVMGMDRPLPEILMELISQGIVEFKWKWTALRDYFYANRIGLSIAPHEIEDFDTNYHVGEYKKKNSPKFERL